MSERPDAGSVTHILTLAKSLGVQKWSHGQTDRAGWCDMNPMPAPGAVVANGPPKGLAAQA
jgi:hypothetical protein